MKLNIQPYEIGKFYRVPVVRGKIKYCVADWPVLGPLHEDSDYINFDAEHYHLDGRFLTDARFKFLELVKGTVHGIFKCVLDFPLSGDIYEGESPKFLGYRLRKCRRTIPQYPHAAIPWIESLSEAYADATVNPESLICPHRGAPLQGLTPDAKDCVTCALHGLKFSCKTGKLVKT